MAAASEPRLAPAGPPAAAGGVDARLAAALTRIAELEALEAAHRIALENLYLHQEELRAQNEELRQAQSSLESARRRHQALFDFAPVAHFLVGTSGMILKANRAAGNLLGLDAPELHGFHMPNLAGGHHQRVAVLALIQAVAAGQAPPPQELELIRKDDRGVRVELHGSRSGAHQETSILLTAVDISHHAGLESERARLAEERRLAAAVFDQDALCLVLTDADWRILRVSRAFAALTGHDGSRAIGQPLDRFIADCEDEALNWRIWQTLREGGGWRGTIRPRRPDGEARPQYLTLAAIRDADGRPRHYLAVLEGAAGSE